MIPRPQFGLFVAVWVVGEGGCWEGYAIGIGWTGPGRFETSRLMFFRNVSKSNLKILSQYGLVRCECDQATMEHILFSHTIKRK